MEIKTIIVLLSLLINVSHSQVIFANIQGPATFENLSSVNENGATVLAVVNGQVAYQKESNQSAVANGVTPNITAESITVHKQTSPESVEQVNVIHSVHEITQVSGTNEPIVPSNVSSIIVGGSTAVHEQIQSNEVNRVNDTSSIQGKPEANIDVIKGPVVILGTGNEVTATQSEQNPNGQLLSVGTTIINNNSEPHGTPIKGKPSVEDQHNSTQLQSAYPITAINEVVPSESKPSVPPTNNIPGFSTTSKPDEQKDFIISFPKY